mmetsp:Transcript_17843/g.20614  ORF Transcript_17843/g.20614 Transcript_17843/m.20614 type:complete len:609 (-) Transcript_17843:42-1868(-)
MTSSARTFSGAIFTPPTLLKGEAPIAFAPLRSSRACLVPRPTRGVCSVPSGGRVLGPSFTRRHCSRAQFRQHYRHHSRMVANAAATYATASLSLSSSPSSSPSAEEKKDDALAVDVAVDVREISSSRGRNAVSLLPVYLTDARAVTKFDPVSAPNGALQLSVAENQMLEDLLVPALRKFSTAAANSNNDGDLGGLFDSDHIYYQPTHGREGLREAMAAYLERIIKLHHGLSLDRDGLVLGAGCNAVLENLCFCLTEPGDTVLLPTPYYAAFEFDLVARAGLNIIPVNTMEFHSKDVDDNGNGTIPQSWYYPNNASLDAAYNKAKEAGSEPKVLLLSHPNNPLGICYPPHVVKECIEWSRKNKIHLVSDEIYAGSVYRKTNDLTAEDTFHSALTLAAEEGSPSSSTSKEAGLGLGPYIHFVYALSKDFALSGLRVGVAYSENKAIRLPMQKLNDLCQISSQTQQTVQEMLSAESTVSGDDGLWCTDEFLPQNNDRIQDRSDRLKQCLDGCKIPYLSGDSGLFLWMELAEFLPPRPVGDDDGEETEACKDTRERILYLELLQEFGLLFTPGRSMRNELPGYFRCVFTAASDLEFNLGLERIKGFVKAKRT